MPDLLDVVVLPPPTANGPLHLGHLSGPFLGADIAARAARLRGRRVLALGGVDVHQNYVLAMAEDRGIDVGKLIDEYSNRISDAYALARIHPDAAINPLDPTQQVAVAGMVEELIADGTFAMRAVTLHRCGWCARTLHHAYVSGACSRCGRAASGGSCEGCGAFTSAQTLIAPSCTRCGGSPVAFTATVPVLRLADFRDDLVRMWTRATLGPRARDLVAGYLADGLPEIPLAYPTDWGVRLDGLRIDVWAELALATFHTVARSVDPAADGLAADRAAWSEVGTLWHFNGIDNAFYFALLWPALYLAAGANPDQLGGTVVNEFFTLDGAKFSTSRDHAIWADDFLATENPLLVRLFLAWQRPGTHATDFTLAAYRRFCAWVEPLLDGTAAPELSGPDPVDELARGLHALEPRTFDPALAVRCLTNALAAGRPGGDLLRALGSAE